MRRCGRVGCNGHGVYQPLLRIRAGIIPADGKDVLAVIRLPFTVCAFCRRSSTTAEIIGAVPRDKMEALISEAKRRTGSNPNPDRTDLHWVRITGHGQN